VEQHHAFHTGLVQLETYLTKAQVDPSKYDGKKIIEMLNQFGPPLVTHLNDEIDTLGPDVLDKVFKSAEEATEITERMVKWGVKTSSMTRAIPFVQPPMENVSNLGYDASRCRHGSLVAIS
jgi:hypothetical protein